MAGGLTLKGKTNAAPAAAPEVKTAAAPAAPAVDAQATDGMVYGDKRKALAFVCALGDPSKDDITPIKTPDGKESKITTPTIVGYKFKLLEDMDIPNCGTTADFKTNLMDFEVADRWEPHKAGEEVRLTRFEAALLLSQPQFNGGCEGGERAVTCSYQINKNKNAAAGTVAAVAQKAPNVSLRALTGSIKDVPMEHVLDCQKEEKISEQGKKLVKITRTPKAGFEKWAPLCVAAQRAPRATQPAANKANPQAQAFLNFVKSRKA